MRGLSFGELLDYCAEENNRWRDFFKQHPDALELPCDIAGTKSVCEVVLHIVAVQMRYSAAHGARLVDRGSTGLTGATEALVWESCRGGGMADTEDLKSSGAQAPCGFESRPRHHLSATAI